MKAIFLAVAINFLSHSLLAQNKTTAPPSWGHYKKLAAFSAAPARGMETFDTLQFILASGETKVEHIERDISGPNNQSSPGKKVAPDSKCDPASCQPGDLVGNGRKREPFYLSAAEKFVIADPPANSSPQTRAELDYLLQLQTQLFFYLPLRYSFHGLILTSFTTVGNHTCIS
jgi:hypothetical protein